MDDGHLSDGDHLASLSMAGSDAAGSGLYTPDLIDLRLTGVDQATDLVIYVHEIHHQALNDSTAWGAALHVTSALGARQRACFRPLLNACRQVHEAYATYAAVSVVAVHHVAASDVLAQYPTYDRLYVRLAALADVAGGPHRQYLLATALARAAMQTPVLSALLASENLSALPSDLRAIDQPDGRWRAFLRAGAALTTRAAAAGDARVAAGFGRRGLDIDHPGQPGAAAADELDEHWTVWETAAYDVLAAHLSALGATVLQFNGHMEPTGAVLTRAREIDPALSLRAARPHSPAPTDGALSAATIQFVRHTLADPPHRARLDDTDRDLKGEIEPNLAFLHARLPQRMLSSFRWDTNDTQRLRGVVGPFVARRTIAAGPDGSVIQHAPVTSPAALRADPSVATVTIAAASCFVDTEWSSAWLAGLREHGDLVVLIDVEAERFTASWVRNQITIRVDLMRVQDRTGEFWATALRVGDDPSVWLHLSDETTVKLLLDELCQTEGLRLDISPEHVADHAALLQPVIEHLLATESYLDLQGLDPETIRRVTDGSSAQGAQAG